MRNKSMFLVVAFFLSIGTCFGQEALVILKPTGAAADACSNGAEPRLVRIRDFKINGKDEVRLAGSTPSAVTRDEFDKMRKIRLRDLSEIEVRNGILFIATGENQKMPAVPDVQPTRASNMTAAQYGTMAFEGQDSASKQRQVTQ